MHGERLRGGHEPTLAAVLLLDALDDVLEGPVDGQFKLSCLSSCRSCNMSVSKVRAAQRLPVLFGNKAYPSFPTFCAMVRKPCAMAPQ